jgi:two-component system chemotaxis response regulator CheB
MPPIRVLVVDDSVVVRQMLTRIIANEADMEVAGIAATASIGLQKITQVQPDVIILDVEMPEMDGIEAVARIRLTWPRLAVLMCSSQTARGADITLRALAAGASDYVPKPSSSGGASMDDFRASFLSKIRLLAGRGGSTPPAMPLVARPSPWARARVSAIVIGSSTGGPNALTTLFATLPANLPVPILIVQHMPPLFTRLLSERLTATSSILVKEVEHGDHVEPGRAYVAPGGFHMAVARDGTATRLYLNDGPPENSCRPAVDVLFRSAAAVYGAGTLGVVLTGMGHDGTHGARSIVEAGGLVVVQDAASCVVPSMPSSVASAGLADAVLPLDTIAAELTRRTSALRSQRWIPSAREGAAS